MREKADAGKIRELMRRLGATAGSNTRIYFTGGATAVLFGWRRTTVDVDIRMVPDRDELLRAIPALKEDLDLNVELASPPDFIPALPGWEDRSVHIAREGRVDWFHFDPYSQALSKIERGHAQDLRDVKSMAKAGLIDPKELSRHFERIRSELHRYPALDEASFAEKVRKAVDQLS